ncbi:hypothetical protein EBU99_14315 [bacterium]|nr:hypothetical protein [bacterium]
MATLTVRKNGSGMYTQVMAAIYASSNGDIIDIGAGTFSENIEFLGKTVTLKGVSRDLTIIQGKATNDVLTGTWFAGDTTITVASSASAVVGKPVSGTGITAGTRIAAIPSGSQITLSQATPTTGNFTRTTSAAYGSGATTVTLTTGTPNPAVGQKVDGLGINATVSAFNSTTRVLTLSSPTTQSGPSGTTLSFRLLRSNISVTQTNNIDSQYPATIVLAGNSNGMVIRDLTAVGFNNSVLSYEAGAISFGSTASPGADNFLIDNCRITAAGDSAITTKVNAYFSNGTIQNCLIDGKTFDGAEPADVPGFSSYTESVILKSVGASTSVLTFSDMRGVIVGSTMTSATGWVGTATVTLISGNDVTVNKVVTGTIGQPLTITLTNIQFIVPNVPRNLVYIGRDPSPNSFNIIFKNNTIDAQTGAVIAATGDKVFNSVVTLESLNSTIEGNTIAGTSIVGAGAGSTNYLFRDRQTGAVVQYNIDYTNGQVPLGIYAPNASVLKPLIAPTGVLVSSSQASSAPPMAQMSAGDVNVLSAILNDPVFKDRAVWKLVAFIFKHTDSSKRLVAAFRDFSTGVQVPMRKRPGIAPGQTYQLHKVIVSDSVRTLRVVRRASIASASSYDFTVTSDWLEQYMGYPS